MRISSLPRRRVSAIVGAGLVLFGASRCGGESHAPASAGPPPGRVPEQPSAEASALAAAQCDYLERCDPDAMFLFPENSRAACEEYFACDARSPPSWGGEEETFTFEGCIESLKSRQCPDPDEQPYDRFSYVPSFPWGPGCGAPDLAAPAPDAPQAGERCIQGFSERALCELGAYCRLDDAPPIIGRYYCGSCLPRLEVGEACDDRVRCVEGTACIEGECREIRRVGQPCEFADECSFGICEASVCGRSPYRTTPYAEVVGGACVENHDCGNQAGLVCRDGTCEPFPNEGEPCAETTQFFVPSCRLGHQCLGGKCVALGCSIDLTEPCDAGCGGGDCVGGVCVPAGGLDAPCRLSCGEGLWCLDGRCTDNFGPVQEENGAPCDFDGTCRSGFCERDLSAYCEGRTCDISSCDKCGVCADIPTVERCE